MQSLKQKMSAFLLNPCKENLLTLDEYESLSAEHKGWASYMQSSWDESEIPEDINPYKEGTKEFEDFKRGSFAAMQQVQEMEE